MSLIGQTTLPEVALPDYDRGTVTAGIVHFGLGNFHRAHQAMFLDRLMSEGEAADWGICGVGILPGDARMRDVLTAQDYLYTLVLKHPDGSLEPRVIGSICDYLFAPDDPDAVVERLADPAIRIVELTITEGGYNIDHVTGEFDVEAPVIRHDVEDFAAPQSVFGLVIAGLQRRRERGIPPFTVMSCDNLPGNGHVARQAFTAFARLVDDGLAAWMDENVKFPNSMVDRITPVTTDADRAMVAERFAIEDDWPVVAEPFVQWVLEDDFTLGRPAYEKVGVQLVDEVLPYELMKLRLLNASHQGMAYFGWLLGHRYAHEAAGDPLIAEYLRRYMDEEARPTLRPVPGIELDRYEDTLFERFTNPYVADTLARLAAESSDRIPKWVLPVIRENLANGGRIRLSAALVASWARYAEGRDENGEPITVVDELRERLAPLAARQRKDRLAFLSDRDVFGELIDDGRFTQAYLEALDSLHAHGARETLRMLLTL